MNSFYMPADFRTATIDRYVALNAQYPDARIADTYGNLTVKNPFGSGRNADKLPRVDFDALAAYVAHSHARGIRFSYTLNPAFMGNRELTPDGFAEIRRFLDRLHEIGVRSLIVAMPSLIELVRATRRDFIVKASAICQINSVNKALLFKQMGVDAIVVEETIYRDLDTLKRIRDAFGDHTHVIVNSICHQDCHLRMFHYNQIAGDSAGDLNPISCAYFPARCAQRLYSDLSNYFKTTWIRPEDLRYYTALGLRHFKLQGRQWAATGDAARAAECYFKGRYDGDLKELLFMFAPSETFQLSVDNRLLDGFLTPFVETPGFCRRDCTGCDYCETYAQKCFSSEAVAKIAAAARETLRAKDPLRRLIDGPAAGG